MSDRIPEALDKVYMKSRMPKQPNGYVVDVLRGSDEVVVRFLDDYPDADSVQSFPIEYFEYKWFGKLGGLWDLDWELQ